MDFCEIKDICQFHHENLSRWNGLVFAIPHHKKIDEATCHQIVKWVHDGGHLVLLGFELGDRHHETSLNDFSNELWNSL